MRDLAAILSDAGIKLKSLRPGHQEKTRCPQCEGGRTREMSLSVKIDADGSGAAWQCHRGTCGHRGGGKVRDDATAGPRRSYAPPPPEPRIVDKPPVHRPQDQAKPPALYAFFAARGISAETVDTFGCYVTRRRFPDPLGEQPAIVFPYVYRGEVVNRKYRPPQKNPQLQERNALPTLFNIDAIESFDGTEIVWVEGEPDVMACHEAGFPQAVTLKDGAPATLKDEDDPAREADKRFEALKTHAEDLAKVKKFILAGDMDEPGKVLREELARRLGRHRCWTVDWPEGCKDAGDVLKTHGAEKLRECLLHPIPWPIDGVQTITPELLLELRSAPPPPVMRVGCEPLDSVVRWPIEGRLIIVTGIPNSGKTPFVVWVMTRLIQQHRRKFMVFSPEMSPWQQFVANMASTLTGKPFWRTSAGPEPMSEGELIDAALLLRKHVTMLVADSEEDPPTLLWILDRARMCVMREGTTDLLIDPWNEVEHARGDLSETDYVGRCLQMLKGFSNRYGVNIWIIAHPTKMVADKPGKPIPVPGLYDVSGGANWANKADIGIAVHRPADKEETEIHILKAKFSRHGRRGNKTELLFDKYSGRYHDPAGRMDLPPPD